VAYLPWWQIVIAGVMALILAQQIAAPNSRVIKLGAGVALFIIAYRTRPFHALCFIGLFFLFPFSIFVGSSTMIFIVLAMLIYLARLTLGEVQPPRRTPVDIGLGVLIACYVLSFYNVDTPVALQRGLVNFFGILASFLLFFMTANFIRTEEQLRVFVRILIIAIGLSVFVGIYELVFPGKVLIPHWILFRDTASAFDEGYRVGGPMGDYELYGEFMAISFFLAFFYYRRATTATQRFVGGSLAILCVFMLLTTVTRGAALAFFGGVVYLLWAIRRKLKFRDFVAIALVAIALYFALNFVILTFTRSGSVIDRIFGTTFVGVIPDSRAGWPVIWAKVLEHPFVGHGPYYDLGQGRGFTGKGLYTAIWPHNQYLFYGHTVGLVGTAAFLFIGIRLLTVSFHWKAISLQEDSYPRSLMVALNVMLLVFLVDQIKIDYLRNDTYQYFPWLLMGLIAATRRIILDQEEEKRRALAAPPETG